MSDLINRAEAISAVSEALKHTFVEHEDIARKIIGKLPSAERTGKWKRGKPWWDYPFECSVCGCWHKAMYDYCPSCGARMSGIISLEEQAYIANDVLVVKEALEMRGEQE